MGYRRRECYSSRPVSPFYPSTSPQLFYLEEQRRLRIHELVTLIQKIYRGWRCRTSYQLMRKSQILISSWFRGNMQKKRYGKIKASVLLIQAFVRGWKVMGKGREVVSPRVVPSPKWFLLYCSSCSWRVGGGRGGGSS